MSLQPSNRVSRRAFIQIAAGAAAAPFVQSAEAARPNILWLTCEDMGPHLRCCGDEYSITPNLDRLAARGCIYRNAWSNAPVCAPARTTIITGVYPTSTGSEHMRSMTHMPAGWKCSRLSAGRRLLLHQQRQGGLQSRKTRGNLGRLQPQRPLAQPEERTAVFRRVQQRVDPRRPDPAQRQEREVCS